MYATAETTYVQHIAKLQKDDSLLQKTNKRFGM